MPLFILACCNRLIFFLLTTMVLGLLSGLQCATVYQSEHSLMKLYTDDEDIGEGLLQRHLLAFSEAESSVRAYAMTGVEERLDRYKVWSKRISVLQQQLAMAPVGQ